MAESTPNQERPVKLDRTEARQGRRGLPVLYVLVGAILLALIAWAVIEFTVR